MAKIEGVGREVCEATEFVAIVTRGEDGPHVVGNWGGYLRALGIGEIVTAGEVVAQVRAKFPWARGALVVRVEEVQTQL
ncbi:MAG: hypothetical protein FJ191_07115 [Gammaproteobacteria bacterium]|nr:hypothetical protein [Gammaproteobacteria bacterium]